VIYRERAETDRIFKCLGEFTVQVGLLQSDLAEKVTRPENIFGNPLACLIEVTETNMSGFNEINELVLKGFEINKFTGFGFAVVVQNR